MSLTTESKKGGPYSKQDQEKRREKVFELHFEQGYSALRIASILGVNRNTVNKDIELWYLELRDEDKSSNHRHWIDKQFTRLEFQRTRLQKEFEKNISLKERLQIEKIITHIDLSIANMVVKIETSRPVIQI